MSPQRNNPLSAAPDSRQQTEAKAIILLPFDSKVASKARVEGQLRQLIAQAGKALSEQVSKHDARQTTIQMEKIAANLDYAMHHRSLALFATPYSARIAYWSMTVPETVATDEGFNLLNVLQQQKESKEYLLLTMGRHHAGIYLGQDGRLSRLVANSPNSTAYSSDTDAQPDVIDQAVRHIDNALTILRRAYHLPLVVAAAHLYIDTFKKLSPNAPDVAAFITNAHTDVDRELRTALQPFLAEWQSMKERGLQRQLEAALQAEKAAAGMEDVWAAVVQKRCKLLVVESGYNFPAYADNDTLALYTDAIPINRPSMAAVNAVEEAALQVLGFGGQVAVVRKGVLDEYMHIAALCY